MVFFHLIGADSKQRLVGLQDPSFWILKRSARCVLGGIKHNLRFGALLFSRQGGPLRAPVAPGIQVFPGKSRFHSRLWND